MSIWGEPLLISKQYETITGNPAIFYYSIGDQDDILNSVKSTIPLTQLGTGTPSLTNKRPIVPYSGSTSTQHFYNVLDTDANPIEQGNIASSNGQNTSNYQTQRLRTKNYCLLKAANRDYLINGNLDRAYVYFYDSQKTYLTGTASGWVTLPAYVSVPSDAMYARIVFSFSNSGTITPDDFQWTIFGIGWMDSNSWYDSQSNLIKIAAGELTWNTGTLKKTYEFAEYNGTENWSTIGSGSSIFFRLTYSNMTTAVSTQYRGCSHYPNETITTSTTAVGYYVYNNNPVRVQFRPNLTDIPNVTAWKKFLADEYSAGTPVTCYWRNSANPEYNVLDGGLGFDPNPGYNAIWTSCGPVTVEYKKQHLLYLS